MNRLVFTIAVVCWTFVCLAGPSAHAASLGTAFTYQGRLDHSGRPAIGGYDLRFQLFLEPITNAPADFPAVTNVNVRVTNGLFTTSINFGTVFNGTDYWMEIGVRSNGTAVAFATQSPRVRLAATPYALFAPTAGAVTDGGITADQLRTAGSPEAGKVLAFDGTSLAWQTAGTVSGAWLLGGNSAGVGNFLGTVNNQPLELKVNNARALRLEPDATSVNLVGGWSGNAVDQGVSGATIAGGGVPTVLGRTGTNRVADHFGTVGGGVNNLAGLPGGDFLDGWFATIGGGQFNRAEGVASTIGGGSENRTSGNDTTVGGGWRNQAISTRATVSGGQANVASGAYSVIGGGVNNHAEGIASVIGGGSENRATNNNSTISGGYRNVATGWISSIGGGQENLAAGDLSTVSGGQLNFASKSATVSGGYANSAEGEFSAIPGGAANRAAGIASFAAGTAAEALHHGTFVWADQDPLGRRFTSTSENEFSVRASGGVRFETQFLRVTGTGNEQAYIGGDGAGGEVHVGSLNPAVNTVAIFNSGASRWMNLAACSLTIVGGCDLAEPFPMKEETIEKGSVVVIDDEHPGRLKRSTRAYDTRVAGIVSGANGINPGIALKQEGALDQGENVALTGRVYVKADAATGPIKPGDLLTTSDNPGHAMRVADHARAQGAILGKAMSALAHGQGLVLVLVTLQ